MGSEDTKRHERVAAADAAWRTVAAQAAQAIDSGKARQTLAALVRLSSC